LHRVSSREIKFFFSFGLFYLLPLNIARTRLRGQFADTKSVTIRAPMDRMEPFGEWLDQQRGLRRLPSEELTQRVGCSVSTPRKIEYGELSGRSAGGGFDLRSGGKLSVNLLLLESKSVATTSISSSKTNLPAHAGEKNFEVAVEDLLN
jgi:hypothetical protein